MDHSTQRTRSAEAPAAAKKQDTVIWQTPNKWLMSWAVFTVLSLVFNKGRVGDVFFWIAAVSLIVWSLLEIFKGVNNYRRILGVIVLIYIAVTLIKNL